MTPEMRAQLGVLDLTMAAELLGCSEETVNVEVAAGRLPHVRFGRSAVFPIAALLDHLNRRAQETRPPEPEPIRAHFVGGRAPRVRNLPTLPDLSQR